MSENKNRIVILLEWYRKDNDRFVGDCEIQNIDESDVAKLFNFNKFDSYYDAHTVTEAEITFLQSRVNVEINLDKYEYFVIARSDEWYSGFLK